MNDKPFDVAEATLDPTSHFETPSQVLAQDGLSVEEQVAILKSWEREALLLQVASGENMPADGTSDHAEDSLRQVRLALQKLNASDA